MKGPARAGPGAVYDVSVPNELMTLQLFLRLPPARGDEGESRPCSQHMLDPSAAEDVVVELAVSMTPVA